MGSYFCLQQRLPMTSSKVATQVKPPKPESARLDDIFYILSQTKPQSVSTNNFQKIGTLGEGGFGKVYLVYQKATKSQRRPQKYAMKVIPKRLIYEKRLYDQLINEKQILADVKHHFLVDLIYAFQDNQNCYFIMEYAPGGDVYSLISHLSKHSAKVEAFKGLGEEGPRFIIACVVLGLECLHAHKLVYRDLKPENVLLLENGYVKLTDFGLSKRVEEDDVMFSYAGTKQYLAPEMVERCGHNKLVDLWALGILLNQLLMLDEPFQPQMIVRGKFSKVCRAMEMNRNWKNAIVSEEAKDLITKLLRVDPESRLGASSFIDIKQHSFFKSMDWQALVQMQMSSPLKSLVERYPMRPRPIRETQTKDHEDMRFSKIEGLSYQPPNPVYQTR